MTITQHELESFVYAAENGDFSVMQDILDNYPDEKELIVNSQLPKHLIEGSTAVFTHGETALYMASRYGFLNIVQFLVENGAKVNIGNKHNETPIDNAAMLGHLDILKYLKLHNAILSDRALIWAADSGYLKVVNYLIEIGCDVNTPNGDFTALGRAAYSNKIETAKVLLKNGANVDQFDRFGNTPLQDAAYANHKDMVELLIHAGANIDLTNKKSWKRAIDYARNPEIQSMLRIYSFLSDTKGTSLSILLKRHRYYSLLIKSDYSRSGLIKGLEEVIKMPKICTLKDIAAFNLLQHFNISPEVLEKIPEEVIECFDNFPIPRKQIEYLDLIRENETKEEIPPASDPSL